MAELTIDAVGLTQEEIDAQVKPLEDAGHTINISYGATQTKLIKFDDEFEAVIAD